MWVPLYTDILLWLLVLGVIAMLYFGRKQPQIETVLYTIRTRKMGVVTAVILGFYIILGLMDSIHYRSFLYQTDSGQKVYATHVKSVLDLFLSPHNELSEKTYSEPFATHLFAKETVADPETGRQQRIHLPLKHGAHLMSDRGQTFVVLIALGLMKAIILTVGLLLLWSVFYMWRRKTSFVSHLQKFINGEYQTCWRSFWLTVFILIALTAVVLSLAEYAHIFGTDKVGDDTFYAAVKSIRTAVIIGTITTLVLLPLSVLLGVIAGFFGGWIDDVIQYIYTTLSSIPGILLIAAFALILNVFMMSHPDWFSTTLERADMRLLGLCIILGVTSWTSLCRLLRAETMKVRELDYVTAARVLGVSDMCIIFRHVLPNVMHLIVIAVVMDFSGLVLAESILSYVGVGVDSTMHSWGNMINSARLELSRDPVVWWPLAAAFILMFTLVIAANLFADVIRDALDPKLRA